MYVLGESLINLRFLRKIQGVLDMPSGKPRGKAVYLPEEVYGKLEKLEMKGARHLYEKIERLINAYEEYRRLYVRKVMCNDFSGSDEKYLHGWFKILNDKLGDPALIQEAMKYLKIVGADENGQLLVVDKSRCRDWGGGGGVEE